MELGEAVLSSYCSGEIYRKTALGPYMEKRVKGQLILTKNKLLLMGRKGRKREIVPLVDIDLARIRSVSVYKPLLMKERLEVEADVWGETKKLYFMVDNPKKWEASIKQLLAQSFEVSKAPAAVRPALAVEKSTKKVSSRAKSIAYTIVFIVAAVIGFYCGFVLIPSFITGFVSGAGATGEVSGFYVMHVPEQQIGPGVKAVNQYVGFYFRSDGTYRYYLSDDGVTWHPQHSGTWSQSGDIITINVPSIPGANNPPYSERARVSADGNKIFASGGTFVRVSENPP